MRILVVSDLFPPVAFGGYERECAGVVAHLREEHEVLVLTSDRRSDELPPEHGVRRCLPHLGDNRVREVVRSPLEAARAAAITRRAMEGFRPELAYVWESIKIPQSVIAVLAEAGIPLAYRVCVPWMARVFDGDRFMRELVTEAGGVRRPWNWAMRGFNRLPGMRLDASVAHPAAVSWVSDALQETSPLSPFVDPVLERTVWPATEQGDRYATQPRAPSPEPTVLFLGRVDPAKGVDVAIRSLALLRDEHGIDARLRVAGPWLPGYRRELDLLAGELGMTSQVEFLGIQEHEQVGALLASAHVLVMPSLWEPFGLVAVEAAFARIPIVASDQGGIVEAIRHEREALLFPPRDAHACASAIAEVLRHPAPAQARVERAFARARNLFTHEHYLEATDRFLEDAMAVFASRDGRFAGAGAGAGAGARNGTVLSRQGAR